MQAIVQNENAVKVVHSVCELDNSRKPIFKTRGPRKSQRGDFMLSLSIALIVVAVISVAAFLAFRDNTRKNETGESIKTVNSTAGVLRTNFGINNIYGDLTTAVAVQSRAIPENQRITGTNTAQNAYGGAVTVAPATLTNTNDAARLTWANVPTYACTDIVIGTDKNARQITVGGAVVKATDGSINITALTGACDVAAPVVIAWDIGRTGA